MGSFLSAMARTTQRALIGVPVLTVPMALVTVVGYLIFPNPEESVFNAVFVTQILLSWYALVYIVFMSFVGSFAGLLLAPLKMHWRMVGCKVGGAFCGFVGGGLLAGLCIGETLSAEGPLIARILIVLFCVIMVVSQTLVGASAGRTFAETFYNSPNTSLKGDGPDGPRL